MKSVAWQVPPTGFVPQTLSAVQRQLAWLGGLDSGHLERAAEARAANSIWSASSRRAVDEAAALDAAYETGAITARKHRASVSRNATY
jgi:hypothetical protein